MTAFAARDVYALELRGLGIVWTTGTISLPGLDPEYRPGLTGVGGQLRASISLLDSRARSSGMTFTLSGDTALELMRRGGEPVEDEGAPVRFLAKMSEFISATSSGLWFSGELTIDEYYTIGGEVIRVLAEDTTDGDLVRYTVERGALGSRAAAWPVYWDPPEGDTRTDDLYLSRMPEAIGIENRDYGSLALVYPAGRPETLSGWPLRLWRSTDGGTAEVLYEGVVSRIRSQGATIEVQTTPQAQVDMARRWRVPAGGWLLVSAIGAVGLTRATAAALEVVSLSVLSFGPGGVLIEGLLSAQIAPRGARSFATGGAVWGIPKCSLESPARISGVQLRTSSGQWLVFTIAGQLDPPFDVVPAGLSGDASEVMTVDDDRYWFFRLYPLVIDQRVLAEKGARLDPSAFGTGERLQDTLQTADSLLPFLSSAAVEISSRGECAWLDALGVQFDGAGELEDVDVAEMLALPDELVERWPASLRGPAPIPDAILGAFGWEDRILTLFATVGIDSFEDAPPLAFDSRVCIRSPHAGRDFGEVMDAQVGARPQAVSVSPGGELVLISWQLPEDGADLVIDEDTLPDTVSLELGERAGVARIVLERDDLPDFALATEAGSLSPRGVTVERDVSAVVDARDLSSVAQAWAGILARYRRSVPLLSCAVRDDGGGTVQALAPGVPVIVRDPVAPNAEGERDLAARGVVMQVSVDTMSRVAQVQVLLVDYGEDAVAPWGPSLLFTGAAAGTAFTIACRAQALDGSLGRFARILERAGEPVECLLLRESGQEDDAVTLTAVDESAGTVSLAAASAVTVAPGDWLILRDFPAQASTGRPTAYYDESRWAL